MLLVSDESSLPRHHANRCDEHGSRALDLGLCALDTMRDGEGGTTRRSPVALVNWRMCMIIVSNAQRPRSSARLPCSSHLLDLVSGLDSTTTRASISHLPAARLQPLLAAGRPNSRPLLPSRLRLGPADPGGQFSFQDGEWDQRRLGICGRRGGRGD
jgi:hypothetical protein